MHLIALKTAFYDRYRSAGLVDSSIDSSLLRFLTTVYCTINSAPTILVHKRVCNLFNNSKQINTKLKDRRDRSGKTIAFCKKKKILPRLR